MPRAKNYRILHERVMARNGAGDRLAQLREQNLAEIGLYQLRRALDLSQVSLAERLNVTQSAISKLEGADDVLLSTLRNYVEALGGKLVLRAEFGDQTVTLHVGRANSDKNADAAGD